MLIVRDVNSVNMLAGILTLNNLRTRRVGNRVAIEAHIMMDGSLPLSEAHDLTTDIERRLKARFGTDTLVTLHMEPVKSQSPRD